MNSSDLSVNRSTALENESRSKLPALELSTMIVMPAVLSIVSVLWSMYNVFSKTIEATKLISLVEPSTADTRSAKLFTSVAVDTARNSSAATRRRAQAMHQWHLPGTTGSVTRAVPLRAAEMSCSSRDLGPASRICHWQLSLILAAVMMITCW